MSDALDDKAAAKKKQKRTSTACEACRRKRAKCSGEKPTCRPCMTSGVACVYDLASDRRKPFTRDVVQAMQMRIDSLELELAQMHLERGSNMPAGVQFYGGPSLSTRNIPTDAFQGGLALNAHGELRFAGPTSSYRAVLADSSRLEVTNVEAARAFSLTRAPVPGAVPRDPSLPRRPPELTHEFRGYLLRLAFEYTLSQFGLVHERRFYRDLALSAFHRTANYSPLLLNVLLGIGCRYIDTKTEEYPPEICSELGDASTRGDVFINHARYLIDQEWYHPDLSTVSALICLSLYLAGRGLDGPCSMFMGQAMRLAEDFGLHLGMHRLAMGSGGIRDELVSARRDTFYAAFQADVILSMYIGRSTTFTYEDVDQNVPPIDHETEFDTPAYRSSAFHNASKLVLIASKMMNSVYALKPNIALASRQASVPELHLELESWFHSLASPLRASTSTSSKAPHPLVIALNLLYHTIMITLHRPFFRRVAPDKSVSVSTEKCLSSAKHVVRLVKLQKEAHTLRYTHPMFQHSLFCCGTILALSAVEDGISGANEKDEERRAQAQNDLRSITAALREVGDTWRTAHTSADVLEALMGQWATDNRASGRNATAPATGTATPTVTSAPSAPVDGLPADGFDTIFSFAPDSSAALSFPFLFPSWNLSPDGASSYDDFMALLPGSQPMLGETGETPFLQDGMGLADPPVLPVPLPQASAQGHEQQPFDFGQGGTLL